MFNLSRLTLGLILSLTAVLVGVRLVATLQPPRADSLLRIMLTNPDGSSCERPCLFGIHPGVAQQADDEKRLARFSWIRDVTLSQSDLEAWFDIAGQNATFFASSNSRVAFYLEIWDGFVPQPVSFPQPSLGDVLATFGVPRLANWKNDALELWYKDRNMFIWCYPTYSALNSSIDPATQIQGIAIYPSEAFALKEFQNIEWHGFVSIQKYAVSQ